MLEVQIYKKLAEFDLDVSFQVDDNILGLMGASGSGKSMTLKCIAGIETPDQGRIVLNNRVLFDSEKKINVPIQKRNVGYMISPCLILYFRSHNSFTSSLSCDTKITGFEI